MRWVRDSLGRLPERPHYDAEEIDRECEMRVAAFLRERYAAVRFPLGTNDLTILVERETSDLDLYADLESGVEGMTEFLPGTKPRVRITRELAEDTGREHRLRTTLAHELGHVWLHAFLWSAPPGSRTQAIPLYRGCGQGTILHARPADWLEWQAGYASGAILMPASGLRRLVAQTQDAHAFRVTAATSAGAALVAQVQRAFDVSREAAGVRLEASGLLPSTRRPRPLHVQRDRRAAVLGAR